MSLQHPGLLWLLLGIPVIVLLLALTTYLRRRATLRFGDPTVIRGLTVGSSGPFRAARAVLFVLGFALILVAIAGPQFGSRTRILHKRGVDIVIALDFSKSMLARDVTPSRIERAKAEIVRLLGELDGDRVGIVAFAGESIQFPMTTDYRALALFFRDLGPYDMPVGGTAIGRALRSSHELLDRASRPEGTEPSEANRRSRVIILMTDGEDHEGDPVAVARELHEAGIKVFTVGIGSRSGEPIPTYAQDGTFTGHLRDENDQPVLTALTEENEQQLRDIAETTEGRYFRAPRGQVGVDQIRAELRQMHQEDNEGRQVTVHEPRFALFLLPGFLLLLLEGLLPEAWVGRRKVTEKKKRARRRPRLGKQKEVSP